VVTVAPATQLVKPLPGAAAQVLKPIVTACADPIDAPTSTTAARLARIIVDRIIVLPWRAPCPLYACNEANIGPQI
jgi:hypothetical protein